jgi:hypothetical protein
MLLWQFVNRLWVEPPVSSTVERTDDLVKAGEHIQLNVLNGSTGAGAARTFTDYLRARKFDVVEMGNFPKRDVEESYIIDAVGDSVASRKIAYALGIRYEKIIRQIDTNAFVDAVVVIGNDYQILNPMR